MVNFAIIGCGHIAKKHAEAIQNINGAKLVAVCDKIQEAMQYYMDRYQVKAYTEMQEMFDNESIDVINICTPSGYHSSIAVKAAEAGKHVIVEKPIALSLSDAQLIIDTCRQHSVKLSVVHPNRFRPVFIKLKEIMDSGKMGKISHANATVRWNRNQAYYDQAAWRGTKSLDGGVLMNQAIHNLDLLLWFMGDAEEVFSFNATRLREIEAEDVSTGVVRFKSGALGIIEAATTIYQENLEETLSIFGETGTVKVGGKTASFIEYLNIEVMDKHETELLVNKVHEDPNGKPGHQWIIEDMIESIQQDRVPAVTGEDGIKALKLVLSLYESAESNITVRV